MEAKGTVNGQATAKLRFVRISPTKARRVVDVIRGMPAQEAEATLRFAPQSASEPVLKLLLSAVANATHNENLERNDLWVAKAYVDEGPTYKRIRPRAQGRAYRILKRSCHITLVVEDRGEKVEVAGRGRRGRRAVLPTRKTAPATKTAAKQTAAKQTAAKRTGGATAAATSEGTR